MKYNKTDIIAYAISIIATGVIWLLIIFSLTGCVTQKACDRKFPPRIEKETIIKDTTIIHESVSFDTLFQYSKDTVFFHDKETNVKVKYIQLPGDSVYINAECPADTIRIPIERTTIIEKQPVTDWQGKITRWAVLVIVLYVVYMIGKSIMKFII